MSAPAHSPLHGTRVLVVDDDEDNREILTLLLEHSGAAVSTAESADEAMGRLEAERPHVLITDIGLPGEDGFSLLRKVRALSRSQGGEIPAIALTGYAAEEFRGREGSGSFQAHLTKPIGPDEVVAAVVMVLGSAGLP